MDRIPRYFRSVVLITVILLSSQFSILILSFFLFLFCRVKRASIEFAKWIRHGPVRSPALMSAIHPPLPSQNFYSTCWGLGKFQVGKREFNLRKGKPEKWPQLVVAQGNANEQMEIALPLLSFDVVLIVLLSISVTSPRRGSRPRSMKRILIPERKSECQ